MTDDERRYEGGRPMTPEMIELYRKVQRFKGEWRIGDQYLNPFTKTVSFITSSGTAGMDDILWIPPVWSEDGRCLWGILRATLNGEDFKVYDVGNAVAVLIDDEDGVPDELSRADTLPAALLRAIGEQEGGRK